MGKKVSKKQEYLIVRDLEIKQPSFNTITQEVEIDFGDDDGSKWYQLELHLGGDQGSHFYVYGEDDESEYTKLIEGSLFDELEEKYYDKLLGYDLMGDILKTYCRLLDEDLNDLKKLVEKESLGIDKKHWEWRRMTNRQNKIMLMNVIDGFRGSIEYHDSLSSFFNPKRSGEEIEESIDLLIEN